MYIKKKKNGKIKISNCSDFNIVMGTYIENIQTQLILKPMVNVEFIYIWL